MGFEGGEEGAKARGEMEVSGVKLVGGGGGDATHFSTARLWVVVARYEALDSDQRGVSIFFKARKGCRAMAWMSSDCEHARGIYQYPGLSAIVAVVFTDETEFLS